MWTFLTFILIIVTLKFASVLGSRIDLNVGSDEVALIPFRWLLNYRFLIVKPKSSPKSKSQIPNSISRGKGLGLGLGLTI